MIWCRACKVLNARGTVYCMRCGRSLGQRRCPDGHESPLGAHYCTHCGTDELSDGSNVVRFGCVTVVAAWSTMLLLLYILVRHLTDLAKVVAGLITWLVTRTALGYLSCYAIQFAGWWVIFGITALLFPSMRPTFSFATRIAFGALGAIGRAMARRFPPSVAALRKLTVGAADEPKRSRKVWS